MALNITRMVPRILSILWAFDLTESVGPQITSVLQKITETFLDLSKVILLMQQFLCISWDLGQDIVSSFNLD